MSAARTGTIATTHLSPQLTEIPPDGGMRPRQSFIVFDSISSIDGLAYKFKATIAPSKDLFLLRVMDSRSARICGRITDQTIFMVMPYVEVI